MNTGLKIIKIFIKIIIEIILAGVAFGVLFNLAWIFGHQIVDGPGLVGNDSDFALSLVSWFGRFWPRVPLWYPLQGAGVSMFHSYPMFSTLLIIWLTKITSFTDVQVFRILSFATFPLTAFGIYVLARKKIGNSVAAFFAASFFLLNQATWVFQRLHGIFAQSFSMIFVPWALLFFDIFLERKLKLNKHGWITRLSLVLTAVFGALCFLAHPVTGMVVVISEIAYAGIYAFSLSGFKLTRIRFKLFFKAAIITIFCLVLTVGLAAFWILPFNSYNKLANREGLLEMSLSQLQEVSLKLSTLAGFGEFRTGDLRYDYFFFALPVILLGGIGLIAGLLTNASLLSWGLLAFGAAIFTTLPLAIPWLVDLIKFIFTAIYFRALIITIVLLPIIAAFGAFFMADWPFMLLVRFARKKFSQVNSLGRDILKLIFSVVRWLTVSLGILAICLFFIIRFEHRPPDQATREFPEYGITAYKAYGPTLGKDVEVIKEDWSILFKKPNIIISTKGTEPAPSLLGFIRDFHLDKTSRVDVSVFSGESYLPRAPQVTEATFVNLYHYFASLIHRMWGYQQGVFYGHDAIYDNPNLLKDLSYWFGIKYTAIVPGFDREANYLKTGWQLVRAVGVDNPLPIYQFPEAPEILTVTNRPVALVIGSFQNAAYDQVFKSGNAGAFTYQDLWPVEGSDNVDDYTLKELSQFSVLILHGYSYHNRAAAWNLIKEYVGNGGRVFIDTGWQYVDKDWGKEPGEVVFPEPAPVVRTNWRNLDADWQTLTLDQSLGWLATKDLKPWLWEGKPWGGALSKEADLAPDSKVLIRNPEGVLVAQRKYGKGTIIWSGMNLFAHAQRPDGEQEIGLLNALFQKLIPAQQNRDLKATWDRSYPDDLTIKLNENGDNVWVLWREAFSPNWHAYKALDNHQLKIYRVGPGFMLMNLAKVNSSTTINLTYRLNWFDGWLAPLISIFTIIFLIIYLIIGTRVDRWLVKQSEHNLPKLKKSFSLSWGNNEDRNY